MEKIDLRCPVCGSTQVYTRKSDNYRRCSKCGYEGEREGFEDIVKAEHGQRAA